MIFLKFWILIKWSHIDVLVVFDELFSDVFGLVFTSFVDVVVGFPVAIRRMCVAGCWRGVRDTRGRHDTRSFAWVNTVSKWLISNIDIVSNQKRSNFITTYNYWTTYTIAYYLALPADIGGAGPWEPVTGYAYTPAIALITFPERPSYLPWKTLIPSLGDHHSFSERPSYLPWETFITSLRDPRTFSERPSYLPWETLIPSLRDPHTFPERPSYLPWETLIPS